MKILKPAPETPWKQQYTCDVCKAELEAEWSDIMVCGYRGQGGTVGNISCPTTNCTGVYRIDKSQLTILRYNQLNNTRSNEPQER